MSHHANFPDTVLLEDIRKLTAAEILAATGLVVGELSLFEGSPPCTDFSMAGNRQKNWRGTRTHAGVTNVSVADLPFEWVRLLQGLRPRVGLMENVEGLVMGAAVGIFNRILDEVRRSGYRVAWSVLDAQWLGVPQRRRRVFVMAVRDDLDITPSFPPPLPHRYSIRDAIGPTIDQIKCFRRGRPLTPSSGDRPAPTIVSSTQHRYEVRDGGVLRPLQIAELARLQTFPDDFAFRGPESEQRRQIGNAVPVLMAHRIGCEVRRLLAEAQR